MPSAMLSRVRWSTWNWSSSSIAALSSRRLNAFQARSISDMTSPLRSLRSRRPCSVLRRPALGVAQHARDGRGELRPVLFLFGELAAAGGGDRVVARAPRILRRAPLGLEPAGLGHAMQRRIERAF